jgi:hypothetical protein
MINVFTSLLDVGPTAEGEIIAPMADNLLAAGKWLKYAGECVYATVGLFDAFDVMSALIKTVCRTTGTKLHKTPRGRSDS